MTDTPLTDAVAAEPYGPDNIVSIYKLARTLERKLREAEAQRDDAQRGAANLRDNLIAEHQRVKACERERDEARAALDVLAALCEEASSHIIGVTGARPGSDSEEIVKKLDVASRFYKGDKK